jgi:nucleotide-binding universal stress UspA family protein
VELEGALMPDAVLEYTEAYPVDLLVMMNRKHSFLERLMLRQNIDRIGFQVQIPLMVVPNFTDS